MSLGVNLEIFLYFSSNEVSDSVPNFLWIDLRVFSLHGGFLQTTLLIGILKDFFLRGL